MPMDQERHFNFFLGCKIFFYFSMPLDYWKIGKKQHFICSNLTLFIVLFFLSFFSLFFLFFFLFFFFSFSLGRRGPPASSNDAPAMDGEYLRKYRRRHSKQGDAWVSWKQEERKWVKDVLTLDSWFKISGCNVYIVTLASTSFIAKWEKFIQFE